MIIDKGVSAGEVVSMKLASGEELIARLVEETSLGYRLSKPMVLSMSNQGIGMMPFMLTVDPEKDITISKSSVTVVLTSGKPFADQYLQSTTGISL